MDQVITAVVDRVMPGKTVTPGATAFIGSSVRSIVRYVAENNMAALEQRITEVIQEPSVRYHALQDAREGPSRDHQKWKKFIRDAVHPRRLSADVQRALAGVATYFTEELVEAGGISTHDDYDEGKVSELRITKANVLRGLQTHDQTIINLLKRIIEEGGGR